MSPSLRREEAEAGCVGEGGAGHCRERLWARSAGSSLPRPRGIMRRCPPHVS